MLGALKAVEMDALSVVLFLGEYIIPTFPVIAPLFCRAKSLCKGLLKNSCQQCLTPILKNQCPSTFTMCSHYVVDF